MESSIGVVSDDSVYEDQPVVILEIEGLVARSGTSRGEDLLHVRLVRFRLVSRARS